MPFPHLEFRYPWRPYQARFLDEIDRHLSDDRLHVVAAPGAGKTTLGLEIFRRLGRPCLVLSPTRIIRNQWIRRLVDFIPPGESPEELPWVSSRLDEPATLTSITYQALHTRFRRFEAEGEGEERAAAPPSGKELEGIVALVRKAGIGTLVLDEAHHLRSAWWRALHRMVEQVPGLRVVSLTATPPYDVVGTEWTRYQLLCGPIDAEISVPELVHSGTLAPHQDFCWLVQPSEENKAQISDYEAAVAATIGELRQDADFDRFVCAHPWLAGETPDEVTLFEEIELVVALLVFLKGTGRPLPAGILRLLDMRSEDLPELDRRWWDVLTKGVLFHPSLGEDEELGEYRQELARRLRARKLLSGRRLFLAESRWINLALATSIEKVAACADIAEVERGVRGESLRQVILVEHIREEPGLPLAVPSLALGAWPIFKAIYQRTPSDEMPRIALLTGRLTLIHSDYAERVLAADGRIAVRPTPFSTDFVRLEADSQVLSRLVTSLLETGAIRLLVGTRALLGEGWDCPAVNSLVLATGVDTYMTTNQMRGRAIRIARGDPGKVASIWHLVALEGDFQSGLADYMSLRSRFRTFVGIHHSRLSIESGLERLQLPVTRAVEAPGTMKLELWRNNREMRSRLAGIADFAEQWRWAIDRGEVHRVIPGIRTESPPSMRKIHFGNTLRWLLLQIGSAFLAVMLQMLSGVVRIRIHDGATLLTMTGMMFAIGFCWALPSTFRAVRAWVRHYPVDGSVRQIALCLCDALCETGVIETGREMLDPVTSEYGGVWSIHLTGATFFEQSLFADCFNEILGPIENPRYLISRRSGRKFDYHAVPAPLATHKEKALAFARLWNLRVARGELIYTRNSEGRRFLLKARARAFSSEFVHEAQRLDQWQ